MTTDAAIDWDPVWSPDGRHITISSDRGGTMNLWRVAMRPGDDLTLDVDVVEARVSKSRPETGIVTFKSTIRNCARRDAVRDGGADHDQLP